MADSKEDLERKRDELRVFGQNKEGGTWDEEPQELRKEIRKLVFHWLILDAEEGLTEA